MNIPYLDLTIQYKAIEPQLNDIVQKVLKGGQMRCLWPFLPMALKLGMK